MDLDEAREERLRQKYGIQPEELTPSEEEPREGAKELEKARSIADHI